MLQIYESNLDETMRSPKKIADYDQGGSPSRSHLNVRFALPGQVLTLDTIDEETE